MTTAIKHYYWICPTCAKKFNGKLPKRYVGTCVSGPCAFCDIKQTLIPWVDYCWGKSKKPVVFD